MTNSGQTGRTLRFTDNLLHDDINLGDVGEVSFDSPSRRPSHPEKSAIFAEADSFIEEPTITQVLPPQHEHDEQEIKEEDQHLSSPDELKEPLPSTAKTVSPSNKDASEISGSRHPRIKVNREVEKIVVSEQSRFSDPVRFSQPLIGKDMGHYLRHPSLSERPSITFRQ